MLPRHRSPWRARSRDDRGLLVLVGVEPEDTEQTVTRMAERLLRYRVFADPDKMNLNVAGRRRYAAGIAIYSGRRYHQRQPPRLFDRAPPEQASELCDALEEALRKSDVRVETGRFGADMQVALVNDGPVTFLLEV